jgi:hypothetical protein
MPTPAKCVGSSTPLTALAPPGGHAAETWPRRHAASVTFGWWSGPTPPTAGRGRPRRRPQAVRARRNPAPPGRMGPDHQPNVSQWAGRDEKSAMSPPLSSPTAGRSPLPHPRQVDQKKYLRLTSGQQELSKINHVFNAFFPCHIMGFCYSSSADKTRQDKTRQVEPLLSPTAMKEAISWPKLPKLPVSGQ